MISPVTYLKDVVVEMQRVSWPTSRMVAIHTVIVVTSMIVIIAIVGGVDSGLVTFIRRFLLKG